MFSYYGSKANIAHLYPPPKYGKIIEPFAGSARYALKYWDREILLVDKYEVIIKIWHYLQAADEGDILRLPRTVPMGKLFEELNFKSEPERLFFSYISGCGDALPRNKPTARKTIDRPNTVNFRLQQVAKNLFRIRNWKIIHGSYEQLPNEEATWFIDPPYQQGGYVYKENKIDYPELAKWSMERQGQVILCENTNADWMDFKPMMLQRGSMKSTTEAIWSNLPTAFDNEQIKMNL